MFGLAKNMFGLNGGWTYRRVLSPRHPMEVAPVNSEVSIVKLTPNDTLIYLGVTRDERNADMCWRKFLLAEGEIEIEIFMRWGWGTNWYFR